jgi:hypothetical protein
MIKLEIPVFWRVINAIYAKPGRSITEIYKDLQDDGRIKTYNYIIRVLKSNPDFFILETTGRKNLIYLTPLGKKYASSNADLIILVNKFNDEHFPENELKSLEPQIKKRSKK